MKRWLVPLAAAVAVLGLLGSMRWFAGPESAGSDTSFAGGSSSAGDSSVDGPPSAGGGTDGSPGASSPGFPGSDDPGREPLPVRPAPKQTNPMGVVIDSYRQHDAHNLAIRYTIGVPECYGKIGEPLVEETARWVTVTLTRIPPTQNADVACVEIALLKSVNVKLSSPLGDREVRDGSFDGALVKPGSVPGDHTQAY